MCDKINEKELKEVSGGACHNETDNVYTFENGEWIGCLQTNRFYRVLNMQWRVAPDAMIDCDEYEEDDLSSRKTGSHIQIRADELFKMKFDYNEWQFTHL